MTDMYNAATGRNNSGVGGAGFTPYSAGVKRYGAGRRAPNVGKTSNIGGYGARDLRNEARRDAIQRRIGRI